MGGANVSNQPQTVKINLEDTEVISCEYCGHEIFQQAIASFKIPSVISPTGKEERKNLAILVCFKCGKPAKGPKEEAPGVPGDGKANNGTPVPIRVKCKACGRKGVIGQTECLCGSKEGFEEV